VENFWLKQTQSDEIHKMPKEWYVHSKGK
jgi:hypothetical protein